ncbi:ATP-binding protein [Virgibacillus sp. SK37]|uniref:ATP-binding protein n=1 Tax=Virgibacillus sp. SK37 TaxID=403957 RepID=UPI0005955F87|nr:ATP-binding protein [Virgibacillus sp. SK37]
MRPDNDRVVNQGGSYLHNENFLKLSSLTPAMLSWVDKNSYDIILVLNKEGRFIFLSESIERILGFSVEKLVGEKWYEKMSTVDASFIKKNFNHDAPAQSFSINVLNDKGIYIMFECTIERLIDKDEVYFISTLRDITDKKESEEMMIRSEKMSVAGQLAAGIAHEIRNPLTSLKGFLQLLQAGLTSKEEYYQIMLEEIEKMEAITTELLFISKPLTDNKRTEAINEMIEDVVMLMNPQAKLKGIQLEFESEETAFVYCDRSQIKQVILNLVKNGIEAMDQPGKITIRLEVNNESIIIRVIDEGGGIPSDLINKIGEPFFTTKQAGTGLGLMISKQILEQHKAILDITQNKDRGSTFHIIFPVK